jgi:pimeloyl-ACP methyl ester carboxylesterase
MTSYERRGAGDPIVLVHGLGSRWEIYGPVLDLLAASHDVISVDLPGFGAEPLTSDVKPGPHGYASWLAELLLDLDVKDPHVVGNSMGGAIALELGRRGVASRVTAFSPIGFWHTPGRIWTQSVLTTLRSIGKVASPAVDRMAAVPPIKAVLVGSVVARPSHIPTTDAILHIRGIIEASGFPAARNSFSHYTLRAGDDLGSLPDIPVTIAWGTRDLVLPHRPQSARARDLMPFARHVDLKGLGHTPFSDDPELCARLILEEV